MKSFFRSNWYKKLTEVDGGSAGIAHGLVDEIRAGIHAVVADVGSVGGGNEEVDLILVTAAEGAEMEILVLAAATIGCIGHDRASFRGISRGGCRSCRSDRTPGPARRS